MHEPARLSLQHGSPQRPHTARPPLSRTSLRRGSVVLLSTACLVLGAAFGPRILTTSRAAGPPPPVHARASEAGVSVELEIAPAAAGAPFHEGAAARFRLRVSDSATGAPLSRLSPAAWMTAAPGSTARDPAACAATVKNLLGGGLFRRADVDLTTFQVVVLGEDATIQIFDPRFGFGGSRLLGLVTLKSAGTDWALSSDQRRLFVAEPAAGRVAVIDTESHAAVGEIPLRGRPSALALQPDDGYLWVAGEEGTLSAITSAGDRPVVAARLEIARGPHTIAFSEDSRHVFVSSRAAGTVTVVDVRSRSVSAVTAIGRAPSRVAYSRLAKVAYVADAASGEIAILDADGEVTSRLPVGEGVEDLAFDPAGRVGIALRPSSDEVVVIDASTSRIVKRGRLDTGPDQVVFTDTLAHVRHRGSETVRMLSLGELLVPGTPLAAADFPGGQSAPGPAGRAATIAQSPGEPAVLVANRADRAIYYYREGMAAPMGSLATGDHAPTGVLVLDRSLRERAAGDYEAAARLPAAGTYDLAVFLDTPRLVRCFPVTVPQDPRAAPPLGKAPSVEAVPGPGLVTGQRSAVRLRVKEALSGAVLGGAEDVEARVFLVPGVWQQRVRAAPAEGGSYEVSFVPPEDGIYQISLESPGLGLSSRQPASLSLVAASRREASAEQGGTR